MRRPILATAAVLILAAVPVAAQQPEQIPEPESPLRAIPERLLESPPILQSREIQQSQPPAEESPEIVIPWPPRPNWRCEVELQICLWPSRSRLEAMRCYLSYEICKHGPIIRPPKPDGP